MKIQVDGNKITVIWKAGEWEKAKQKFDELGLMPASTQKPFGLQTNTSLNYYKNPNDADFLSFLADTNYAKVDSINSNLFKDGHANLAILRVIPTRTGDKAERIAEFQVAPFDKKKFLESLIDVKFAVEKIWNEPTKVKVRGE